MKRFLSNIKWEKVLIVGFFLFIVILAVSVGSCSADRQKELDEQREAAARMYEVEAAETRGYLNALKDTGNAPRPTGGAK